MSTRSLHNESSPAALRASVPLRAFVAAFERLVDTRPDEPRILREGAALLADLVARDDWLPAAYARSDPERYRQFLLHLDPAARFSVVSFVWGPGQTTPIHDHTVWGLIGMLRGAEYSQPYALAPDDGRPLPTGDAVRLEPGRVEAVSPAIGDIHRVSNAFADRVSISIHVYGADIGAVERSVYRDDGARKPFVSGYSRADVA
ncbi:cysteine dioxygenase [Burkholderia oklahomensis]|uniref:cysteine dioxygenase family protein n=1 Tax=Burkholderia oklahomensis TaxID=342113 RepID=UPI00057218EF|nr:cysteine dioxygenase [Burkholderia oklahomensis]AOI40621.1 cysteine dioxygenase [Burkholderia oklahomensis EO147]KUY67732.1 cysteine dioxygenase [Burkholderia oklahomensis EO147]